MLPLPRWIVPALLLAILPFLTQCGEGGASTLGTPPALEDTPLPPADLRGFEALEEPRPGQWRAVHKEPAQSFLQYRYSAPPRPLPHRRTLVLQPIGPFSDAEKKLLETLKEYAEVFFQLPARIAEPIGLEVIDKDRYRRRISMGARHGTYDRQYNAGKIVDEILARKMPDDAVAVLGITMQDLWVEDLNYVFGIGSWAKRAGVYSLCRYFPEFWGNERRPGDELLGLRRACKVLNHEAGHMFGIHHCVHYKCSMNGSNSLDETDAAPIHFCPVCHRKLRWNIGFDAAKRYAALEEFYRRHGMDEEAAWIATRRKNWVEVEAQQKGGEE